MGLSYVFKTPLKLTGGTDVVASGALADGITIPRVISSKLGATSTGATGVIRNQIFEQNPIVPQWGDDLYKTAPFCTNYEGTIHVNAGSAVTQVAFVWLEQVHLFPGGTTLTSVRAIKIHRYGQINYYPLGAFDSYAILSGFHKNGGKIGLRINLCIGFFSTTRNTDADKFYSEISANRTPSVSPTKNATVSSIELNNSAVTFTQSRLSGGYSNEGSFSYNISTNSDKIAYIRLRIQDTDEDGKQFTDEEIQRVLDDENGDVNVAVDTLLTIRKIMLSNEPSTMQIGQSAIRQDVEDRLKALDAGQRRAASLEPDVKDFETSSKILGRADI